MTNRPKDEQAQVFTVGPVLVSGRKINFKIRQNVNKG